MNWNDAALAIYIICFVIFWIAEAVTMAMTGATKQKIKKEWTLYLIALPFDLAIIGSILENRYFKWNPSILNIIVGVILFGLALLFRLWGHLYLKKGFSVYIGIKEGQPLVTAGIYKYIRHPLYLGTFFIMPASSVLLAARWSWIFTFLGLAGTIYRIDLEERFLATNYPEYRKYQEKTWRLLPGIY